ncbi:MAG: TIM barrel protein [Gemmatimonadetes bacterium]|nr:TIM barrel protein [Gemmatimonadota bacterium]
MPTRRTFLKTTVAGVAASGLAGAVAPLPASAPRRGIPPLRQSVCRWPFGGMPLDAFCTMVRDLGFGAVDLVDQGDWATVRRHGLAVSTANSSPRRDFIAKGLNDPANHAMILAELESVIPAAQAAGIPNVIAMFGNRVDGIDDAAAIANCASALARIAPTAERHGVTVILEMLNSRVDHRGFQGDTTPFGVAVCERVGSPRVRLLYDIYHMQIMEGDVIRTIRDNHQWFAHYHTAGNPGRNELSAHQELQYGAIAEAIVATGFTGWLAHEFMPTGDARAGLAQAREVVGG